MTKRLRSIATSIFVLCQDDSHHTAPYRSSDDSGNLVRIAVNQKEARNTDGPTPIDHYSSLHLSRQTFTETIETRILIPPFIPRCRRRCSGEWRTGFAWQINRIRRTSMDKVSWTENRWIPSSWLGRTSAKGGTLVDCTRVKQNGYGSYVAGHDAQFRGFRGNQPSFSMVHILREARDDLRHPGSSQYIWRKVCDSPSSRAVLTFKTRICTQARLTASCR